MGEHKAKRLRFRNLSQAKKFAEVECISVCGVPACIAPVGLWIYADAYVRAAASLPDVTFRTESEVPYDPVRYYLACHLIELSLKAYLSLKGATMLELSENSYGHNLVAILAAADSKGLSVQVALTQEHTEEIRMAAIYYSGKVFEYPAVGEALKCYPSMPKLAVLTDAAILLVDKLAQPCRDAK